MSESNSSEERTPGLKRKLTWKLIAAVVFVIAGTVAVAYSMQYCRDCNTLDQVAQNELDDGDAAPEDGEDATPQSLQLKSVNMVSTEPPELPSKTFKSANSKETAKTSNSFTGSFQPKTTNRVTTQRPAAKSLPLPPIAKQTGDGGGIKNSFTSKKPFTPVKTQISATQDSFVKPVQDTSNAIANSAQSLKDNAGQFASNVSNNLKATKDNLAEKTGNALRKFTSKVPETSRNLTGQGSQSRSGFSPPTNNRSSNTSNASASNLSPPARGAGSAGGSSTNLQGSGVRNNLSSGNLSPPVARPNPPVNNRPTNRALNSQNLRPTNPVSTTPGSNTGRITQNNRVTQAPTTRGPVAQVGSAATLATPGDRRLEGPQSPSVTIEKIAPREIQVNQPADFQLVVKNVGRIAARNVNVFDQIPTGAEFVESVPPARRGSNGQISWRLESLEPGQEKRIRIQLRPTRQGEIGSVAQVTFSAQASMRTKVTKPVLSVSHSTQPRVLIGDPVILDINVKNDGDGPARDVVIQEDLPEQLAFSEGFRELEYAIGTLGPGQSRKVRLELKAAQIGKFKNVLVAHAGGGLQTQHAVDVEVVAPQLVAQGDGPNRRFLRREATHRFSVRNTGTAKATNVELVSRLPSGLKYVSTNNRGKYDENTHAVYWSLAELNAGLIANVELTTVPTEPGNQDIKFEVVSDLDQTADAICKLNVEHLIDVFFDIDDLVDPIEIGSNTAYKLRIVNQGTKTATNVQLQVEFPRGIQPTAVEGIVTNEIRGQQIAFSPITSMNPGDEIVITIHGKGLTAGDHRINVNLIADGREVRVAKQESTRVYSDR